MEVFEGAETFFKKFLHRTPCSSLLIQHARGEGALYLHCTKWTELLTAEAFNTLFAVNYGLTVLHGDCLCGADLLALFAALTLLGLNVGLRFETFSCNFAEKL